MRSARSGGVSEASNGVNEEVRWVQPGDVRSVRSDGVSEEVILGCVAPLSSLPWGLTWGYPLLLLVTPWLFPPCSPFRGLSYVISCQVQMGERQSGQGFTLCPELDLSVTRRRGGS